MAKRTKSVGPEPKTVTVVLDERLPESPTQATSLSLPAAIYHRLNVLADCAQDVRAARAEIIAMLIAEAAVDADELERKILAYRKKTVADVLPASTDEQDGESGGQVVDLPVQAPGRPPRRRTA